MKAVRKIQNGEFYNLMYTLMMNKETNTTEQSSLIDNFYNMLMFTSFTQIKTIIILVSLVLSAIFFPSLFFFITVPYFELTHDLKVVSPYFLFSLLLSIISIVIYKNKKTKLTNLFALFTVAIFSIFTSLIIVIHYMGIIFDSWGK